MNAHEILRQFISKQHFKRCKILSSKQVHVFMSAPIFKLFDIAHQEKSEDVARSVEGVRKTPTYDIGGFTTLLS